MNLGHNNFIIWYLFKTTIIWLLLTTIVILFSSYLILPFLYFFGVIAEFFTDGFSFLIKADEVKNESAIIMQVTTTKPVYTASGEQLFASGISTSIFAHSLNVIVPIVILFSLILAWPIKIYKQYFVMLCSAVILGVIILLLTVPFQLFGIYLNHLVSVAAQNQQSINESIIHYWQVFCDAGGVWLLAVIAALVSIYLGERQVADLKK